jgi:hypothetical protein
MPARAAAVMSDDAQVFPLVRNRSIVFRKFVPYIPEIHEDLYFVLKKGRV